MVTVAAAVQALSSITGAFFSPSRAYLKEQVAIWCGVFAAIGAAALVSGFLQGYCFTLMGARLTRRLRVILIRCLMKQARAPLCATSFGLLPPPAKSPEWCSHQCLPHPSSKMIFHSSDLLLLSSGSVPQVMSKLRCRRASFEAQTPEARSTGVWRTEGRVCRPLQEMAFFDKSENSSGALVARLGIDTAAIRGAVGDQVGVLSQNLASLRLPPPVTCHAVPRCPVLLMRPLGQCDTVQATFIAGFVIAFSAGWKMTLVIVSVLPLLIFASYMETRFLEGFSSKVQLPRTLDPCDAFPLWRQCNSPLWCLNRTACPCCLQATELYSQANQMASDAFGACRTVAAFNLRAEIHRLYCSYLDKPERTNNRRWGLSQHILRRLAGGLQQRIWQVPHVRPFLLSCLQGSGLWHRLRNLSGQQWEELRNVCCTIDWPAHLNFKCAVPAVHHVQRLCARLLVRRYVLLTSPQGSVKQGFPSHAVPLTLHV